MNGIGPPPPAGERGLTLLELIVALAIFALVATASYSALEQGISIQDRLQEKRRFWQRLEVTFNTIERDLAQAVDRVPRVSAQEWTAPLHAPASPSAELDANLFRFTRGGLTSFREGPVSPYQRVSYRFPEDRLVRASWPRADAPRDLEPQEVDLITGLAEAEARFLATTGARWLEQWPPPQTGLTGESEPEEPGLPLAVELTLTFEKHGEFKRVFHVGIPR